MQMLNFAYSDGITDVSLEYFMQHCPHMEVCVIECCIIHSDSILLSYDCKSHISLQALLIGGYSSISDSSIIAMSTHWPYLHSIDLTNSELSDHAMASLLCNPQYKWRKLWIDWTCIEDRTLRAILKVASGSLELLSMRRCSKLTVCNGDGPNPMLLVAN